MKFLIWKTFVTCGLLLTLAALPVFAQEKPSINELPFRDLAEFINQEVAAGKVDLTKPFSIELESVLTKDGKLDAKTVKFTKSAGDPKMVEIGKKFIEAANDSGIFRYLSDLGVEKINLALAQDEKQVTANIKSQTATVEKSKMTGSGYNTLIAIAKMQSKNDDEKLLLNSVNIVADGKNFAINFAAPRETIYALVKKHLEAVKAKDSGK